MVDGPDVRVLQAMARAAHGGAELFFERLVLALHRASVHQHILIRRNAERGAKLREGGMQPVELAFGGKFDFFTGRSFTKEIKRFQPHVVLTWMNRATSFCPPKRKSLPPFVHVGRLGADFDLKYYHHCDHLICNTRDLLDTVVGAGWAVERAHYMPDFVDERTAPPVSRKEFYTPDSTPLIFALGRLHPNKGFDTLLHALSRVSDVYLWIAGDGPERAALETLAKTLGIKPRVRFLGWRDDAPALHAASDLFVCPSRHEPLGNVVLEAWAQRKPVLATASQGPAALIKDGVNGRLVPVDDAVALAESLRALLRDPDQLARLAERGRASFEAEFTEARVVAQYKDFFATVTASCAASPD